MNNQSKKALEAINKVIKDNGGQALAAKFLGITQSYLSDIVNGRRGISKTVADKIGFEWRLEKKK